MNKRVKNVIDFYNLETDISVILLVAQKKGHIRKSRHTNSTDSGAREPHPGSRSLSWFVPILHCMSFSAMM